jgi:hypothetical protein
MLNPPNLPITYVSLPGIEGIESVTATGPIFPEWKVVKLSPDELEGVPGAKRKYWTKLEGAFVI